MLQTKATVSEERLASFSMTAESCLFVGGCIVGIKGQIPWNKGKKWPKEVREKISRATKGRIPWIKGKHHTEKTKRKLSLVNTGRTWKLSKKTKDRMRLSKMGNKNPMWKGNSVQYAALHAWVERNFGKPKICFRCKTTTAKKYEWANISGKYIRDVKDFIRLCITCHRMFYKTESPK